MRPRAARTWFGGHGEWLVLSDFWGRFDTHLFLLILEFTLSNYAAEGALFEQLTDNVAVLHLHLPHYNQKKSKKNPEVTQSSRRNLRRLFPI